MESTDVPDPGTPILKAKGLWKVFGENPERLFKSDLKNDSKEKIQEETGLVVGLRDISFEVQKGEIFVLMGLSGSGKSTLMQVLFRLIEPADGKIIIDSIDISTVGLHDLRSRLSIIPQEPTLFEGTVRGNLDPLGEHSDHELWQV